MSTLTEEISKRRTFAIISHPDAGKTTLTEKLLLFGGAIHIAGAVKSNKIKKTATSDWMEIEKQRGISVATSVMGFNYGDYKINILDTPGHQDFAEDTYRTLTAVDSVIIVVDVAKGVETQTRKLMEVCRMRNTPVIVFVNKLDREGRDPFDILDELEAELKIAENNLTTGTIEAKQTYENAMTNYKYADQLYEIDTDGLEDDLNDARETLEECEENLEEFESQIGDGIVYAGYSGSVVEVAYGAGDNVINDATVVTYMDQDEVSMTVSVSQDDISSVAVGDTATVYLTAYDGEPFEATVTEVATSSTSGSSTVNNDVTVRITADSSKIYSGMTGEVSIAGKSAEDTLYISNQAVHMDGTRSFVKVLEEDGTIVETDIETGFSNGNTVAVVSGLEKGDTVLIESQVTE